jgi:hypothetical protein
MISNLRWVHTTTILILLHLLKLALTPHARYSNLFPVFNILIYASRARLDLKRAEMQTCKFFKFIQPLSIFFIARSCACRAAVENMQAPSNS